ncbi:hypothetical protein KY311_04565 [Candidatus Woesearchaeota archaeon]|nr:hypothetical protein [Candidatus Woesearchaeota archaeon]
MAHQEYPPRGLRHNGMTIEQWNFEFERLIERAGEIPLYQQACYKLKSAFMHEHHDEYFSEYRMKVVAELQSLKLEGKKFEGPDLEKRMDSHNFRMLLVEAAIDKLESNMLFDSMVRSYKAETDKIGKNIGKILDYFFGEGENKQEEQK